jgi:hypothetical protein
MSISVKKFTIKLQKIMKGQHSKEAMINKVSSHTSTGIELVTINNC